MGKHFFDFEDGDFAHSISDNMAIDSDGDLLMRMGDNMAMDMDSGELHIISGWPNDEDDDYAAPNTDIDEVGILVSTFSNLFK